MEPSHNIHIQGFVNPKEFVQQWSSLYAYGMEDKYEMHIHHVLDSRESFFELFKWKNGTGGIISRKKTKTVEGFWEKIDSLRELREHFDWELFEHEFQPQRTSNIWKIFLLHLVKPTHFPIYDQHVYRFYHFHKTGVIQEIPKNHSARYLGYKQDYLHWFNDIKTRYDLHPKKKDESFIAFGQFLKDLNPEPLEVRSTK